MNQMERKSKPRRRNVVGIILACTITLGICGAGIASASVTEPNSEKTHLTDVQMMDTIIQEQEQELAELNKVRTPYLEDVQNKIDKYEEYITNEQNDTLNELIQESYKCKTRDQFSSLVPQFDAVFAELEQAKEEAELVAQKAKEEEEARKAAEQAALEKEEEENTIDYGDAPDLRSAGVVYYNGWRFTWYSSNILYHYRTGEWHVNNQGFWCDENGYLIAASSTLSQGSTLDTPWGTAIIRDSGCASNTIDMYVCW